MHSKQKSTSSNLVPRPAIVSILGHVDHGKTTLLDAIRKSNLVSKEHGGITQHIGAYQIDYKGEKITFIDTPGHAAFAKMRSQGASITDLVILVVAANDGIMPQTKECLEFIKKAKATYMVAINKIDLPDVSLDKIKGQLAENSVLVEGYGGDVVCIPISAKENKGMEDLLEMILLIAKMKELKADPKGFLEAVIIDSRLDAKKGTVVSAIVKNGTLKVKDRVFAGTIEGKVRKMTDENGQVVTEAGPSKPIEILGFSKVPEVGAIITSKPQQGIIVKEKNALEEVCDSKKINLILRTDTLGSLEAIKSNLPQEVNLVSVETAGQITESDVLLAISTCSRIIGFNVKIPPGVKKLAELDKISIEIYEIIYDLFDDIEKQVLKLIEPTINEEILGEAEIIAEFKIRGNHIAGCKIKKGKISKNHPIHLKRGEVILADAKITSFQKENQEAEEAKVGAEIGLVFSPSLDFKIGDAIISYKI